MELGRIKYLFADKTGVLTQNLMEYKKLYSGDTYYETENVEQMKDTFQNRFTSMRGPMEDVVEKIQAEGPLKRPTRRDKANVVILQLTYFS